MVNQVMGMGDHARKKRREGEGGGGGQVLPPLKKMSKMEFLKIAWTEGVDPRSHIYLESVLTVKCLNKPWPSG